MHVCWNVFCLCIHHILFVEASCPLGVMFRFVEVLRFARQLLIHMSVFAEYAAAYSHVFEHIPMSMQLLIHMSVFTSAHIHMSVLVSALAHVCVCACVCWDVFNYMF
jgi:hypothetical protein